MLRVVFFSPLRWSLQNLFDAVHLTNERERLFDQRASEVRRVSERELSLVTVDVH